MADGDDLVIGENNQAQSTTKLVLTVDAPLTTILKCYGGDNSNIGVHAQGRTGLKGDGGFVGVHGVGGEVGVRGSSEYKDGVQGLAKSGVGVTGSSESNTGVWGLSETGIGVSGSSKSETGVLGGSDTGIGVRGSVGQSPFALPSKVGVLGESNKGVGVAGHAFNDTGVVGRSVLGIGIYAETGANFALYASAPKGIAVNGESKTGYGVRGASDSGFGVFGKCPKGFAGYFEGNVLIKGDLTKTGAGSAVAVQFPDRTFRRLYAIDSPESWFEDFGEARLVKGKAEVKIERNFAQTVNLEKRYHVFVTPHSTKISGLAVVAREPDLFRVEHPGGASGTFSYRIVARRADIRGTRLERIKIPAATEIGTEEAARPGRTRARRRRLQSV